MNASWGLVVLGVVIVGVGAIFLWRGFQSGKMSIQAQSFSRIERPKLFWTGAVLHFAYICVGAYGIKIGLNL